MQTICGQEINTSTVQWVTSKGVEIELTLSRNVHLTDNGYLPSGKHEMSLTVNDRPYGYNGAQCGEHGYCLRSGSTIIQVPADHQDAVKALVGENEENRRELAQSDIAAEKRYHEHTGRAAAAMRWEAEE